jgi:hypothetical protein
MARGFGRAAGLAVLGSFLLAPALLAQGYEYPPQKHGTMAATLEVLVADKGAGPGFGRVTLSLVLNGGTGLEVETPRLEDATDAWKIEGRASSWLLADEHVTWCQTLRLVQVKPGSVPVPGVKVRFRDTPGAGWEEAEWLDILKQPRDVPPPEEVPAPASVWRPWLPVIGVGIGVVILIVAGRVLRRRPRPAPPLAPPAWAERELDRLEQTALPPAGEAGWYFTQLSSIVRRYLSERFSVRAPQQTTAELFAAARSVPQLSASHLELLRAFCERCDLVKFAQAATTPEECRQATCLARTFVRETGTAEVKPAV